MKMTIHNNIRNHPYHFEQMLQQQEQQQASAINSAKSDHHYKRRNSSTHNHFTWLVFINAKWVPFDQSNQQRLEQTLGLGGTFVDIKDPLFPAVKKVRVFPKANYLSYLGVKYRLSRVMQPQHLDMEQYQFHDSSNTNTSFEQDNSAKLLLLQVQRSEKTVNRHSNHPPILAVNNNTMAPLTSPNTYININNHNSIHTNQNHQTIHEGSSNHGYQNEAFYYDCSLPPSSSVPHNNTSRQ